MPIKVDAPSQDSLDVYSIGHLGMGVAFAFASGRVVGRTTSTALLGTLCFMFLLHIGFELFESSSYGIDVCRLINGRVGVEWPSFSGDSAINSNFDTLSFITGFFLLNGSALCRCLRENGSSACVSATARVRSKPKSAGATTRKTATTTTTAVTKPPYYKNKRPPSLSTFQPCSSSSSSSLTSIPASVIPLRSKEEGEEVRRVVAAAQVVKKTVPSVDSKNQTFANAAAAWGKTRQVPRPKNCASCLGAV